LLRAQRPIQRLFEQPDNLFSRARSMFRLPESVLEHPRLCSAPAALTVFGNSIARIFRAGSARHRSAATLAPSGSNRAAVPAYRHHIESPTAGATSSLASSGAALGGLVRAFADQSSASPAR
jgi:hypothetical protein